MLTNIICLSSVCDRVWWRRISVYSIHAFSASTVWR